jgi:hypothetical protein
VECCLGKDKHGNLATDIRTLVHDSNDVEKILSSDIEWNKHQPLDKSISMALKAYTGGEDSPRAVLFHNNLDIRGRTYVNHRASRKDCNIFFQPKGSHQLIPGIIEEIFAVPIPCTQGYYTYDFYLAIKRLLPLERPPLGDPLSQFPDFGAALWSDKLANHLEVIDTKQHIHHSIRQPWADGIVVVKPLDRVSVNMQPD